MKHIQTYESFLNEGRSAYDGLASKLTKQVFKHWVNNYVSGNAKITYTDEVVERGLEFDIEATLYVTSKVKGFEVLDSTGADGRDTDDEGDDQTPFIVIDFAINPDWLPREWSITYFYLADVIRHEMEHITQDGKAYGNYRMGKPNEDDSAMRAMIKAGFLPQAHYMMLPKEVDANLQGLRFEAKKRKEPLKDAINRYLDAQEQGGVINGTERSEIMDLWRLRAKKIGGFQKF